MSNFDELCKYNFIATMSRSYDSYHIKNNIIHLIVSGVYSYSNLNLPDPVKKNFIIKVFHKYNNNKNY